MAEKLQRTFELVLYGKDSPNQARRPSIAAASERSERDSIVDPESPSKIAQPSPTHWNEKSDAIVSEQSLPSTDNNVEPALQRSATWRTVSSWINLHGRHGVACWEPTAFSIRPLSGLAAIVLVVACVFGSLAILVVSDNSPVDNWPVAPTVFLAIVTAIANSSLTLAHAQAKPITWWYRASRGASVRALESHWHTTNTVGGAIYYGRLSLLTVACIATSLAIIDGPLLQKASTVRSATVTNDITLSLELLPELPTGFSAGWVHHEIWYYKDGWFDVRDWSLDTPMKFKVPDCTGSCKATVQAPGVVRRDCSSQTWPIDRAMIHNVSASWGTWTAVSADNEIKNATSRNNPAFYVNLINGQVPGYPADAKREGAYLTVGLAQWVDFEGAYVETNCWLKPAIVEYDVVLDGKTINFDGSSNQGRLVALANNTHPADIAETTKVQKTTIDGITEWLSIFVNANASVGLSSSGGKAAMYSPDFSTYNPVVGRHMNLSDIGANDLTFLDPTEDVIFKFNQMMLRGGVLASSKMNVAEGIDPGLSLNQTVKAKQSITQNVFKSDLRWYGGATAIELITVLLVLPMFWGWWTLGGTNYTMSPLTMALAFDSPLLSDVNSAAGAKGVVREIGNVQLKFGLVSQADTALESANGDQEVGTASGRLGIAEAGSVVRPRNCMRFSK